MLVCFIFSLTKVTRATFKIIAKIIGGISFCKFHNCVNKNSKVFPILQSKNLINKRAPIRGQFTDQVPFDRFLFLLITDTHSFKSFILSDLKPKALLKYPHPEDP